MAVNGLYIQKIGGVDEIMREVRRLRGPSRVVKAGFLAGATNPKSGLPEAAIAAYNEFGRPSKGQPPRPFMDQTYQMQHQTWFRILNDDAVLFEKREQHLKRLGRVMAEDIQARIGAFTSPELAESTIRQKGSPKPLIRDGDMMRAVDSEVVDRFGAKK